MGSNYPAGTWEGDTRAPWNQPEPWEGKTCGDCSLQVDFEGTALCLYCPMREGEAKVVEVNPDDPACEAIEPAA
jgi:hypothetical protein